MQQKGCVVVMVAVAVAVEQTPVLENNKPLNNKDEQKKSSSTFRNASLDAFDQDLVKDSKAVILILILFGMFMTIRGFDDGSR